ncbi:SMI1/KNR4 family protein [Pseudoalteromonas rhizosphaerae]|uniref:SMI1/KNR4 family protein n=1 Tax=Pseudoalteromonas rhizosphaerae TaxID=2518973 RepID=UPI002148FE0E|nr:SMI1/KNR4 family protein [Pseudoalteromonas rhizosphaerae]
MASMNIQSIKAVLRSWIDEGFIEGELSVEPEWYVLWRPEEIEEFNRDYQLSQYAPGFLTFGGNGGGELLVVNEIGEVFYMPTIGMAPDAAIKIASSLQEFKGYMEK